MLSRSTSDGKVKGNDACVSMHPHSPCQSDHLRNPLTITINDNLQYARRHPSTEAFPRFRPGDGMSSHTFISIVALFDCILLRWQEVIFGSIRRGTTFCEHGLSRLSQTGVKPLACT